MKTLLYVLVGLAMVAALVYFLTGMGILQPGDLQSEEASPIISFVAGGCYLAGTESFSGPIPILGSIFSCLDTDHRPEISS